MPVPKARVVWLYPKIAKPMGGTNFVLSVASELKRDYDIVLIAQETTEVFARACRGFGVDLIDLNLPTYTDFAFWFLYPFQMRRLVRRIAEHLRPGDIVISSMFPMHVAAQRLGRNDVEIVYEPFAFFYDSAFLAAFGFFYKIFFQAMFVLFGNEERKATQKARRLLALSGFEQKRIEAIYGRKADVIYEGVDTAIFHPADITVPDEYAGKTIVLHSTGFDRFKGTDTVIAAIPELAKKLPSLLLLVTYTREEPRILAGYKKQLEKAGVTDNVRFLGSVPYDALPNLYRMARVYVEPGQDRSMSLSVKEAMACGTPVVRGSEGYEEITDGVEGYLVAATDIAGFVDRVVLICTDRDLRNRQSKAAVERVRTQFTWAKVAARIGAAVHDITVINRK